VAVAAALDKSYIVIVPAGQGPAGRSSRGAGAKNPIYTSAPHRKDKTSVKAGGRRKMALG
jgi:hypothetical protein